MRPTDMNKTTDDVDIDKHLIRRREAVSNLGLSSDEFDGAYRRLSSGLFVPREVILSAREHVMATFHAADGDPVVARTAAAIMHGSIWYDDEFTVDLIRHPTGCGKRRRGSQVYRTELSAADVVSIDGISVTSAVRTAFDLGRVGPPWRALGYLDALARATGLTSTDLVTYVQAHRRVRGIVQLREVAALADGRAESPPESWLRLILIRGGLPSPDLQIEVEDGWGHIYARIDLGYESLKIAVEYDGEDFHSTPEQLAHDAERDRKLDDDGWKVIRVRAQQVRDAPWKIVTDVGAAIKARGGYF